MRDDRELLREYVGTNSDEAFRLLVERHYGMVLGIARRMVHDAALIDEICQAVFILLARKAHTLPAGIVLAGWLHQATRFVAHGAIRGERRRQERHRQLASMNELNPADADANETIERIMPHLDASLSELGTRDRDAIVLRFLEGLPFADVAAALGTTEAAAKMRVGRALDRLRSALARQGVSVPLVALGPALLLQLHPATASPVLAKIATVAVATASQAPTHLALIDQAIRQMTLHQLRTALSSAVPLVLGLGVMVIVGLQLTAQNQAAAERSIVTTFEPISGDWEGSVEFHSNSGNTITPGRQPAFVTIRTSNGGRDCSILWHLLDRNERTQSTHRVSHTLSTSGDRVTTTEELGRVPRRMTGPFTESMHVAQPLEWRAGFQAGVENSPDVVAWRWSRQDNELFISRTDWTVVNEQTNETTAEFILRPHSGKPRTAVRALPRGTQVMDGVTFQIDRPLNLIGARAARAKGSAFAWITDNSIRGRGRHIHVLHTGDHGVSASGDPIWRLVLRYADGATESFDFEYDTHLRNYWRRDGDGPATPSDPDTSIAWTGTSVESDRTGATLVVSRTTVANPRPDTEIVGADYVSLFGPSSAYILGVTVSNDGRKPMGQPRGTKRDVRSLTMQFRNAAGALLRKLPVELSYLGDDFKARVSPRITDDRGQIALLVPVESIRGIRYQVRLPIDRTRREARPQGLNGPAPVQGNAATNQVETGEIELLRGGKEWPIRDVRLSDRFNETPPSSLAR